MTDPAATLANATPVSWARRLLSESCRRDLLIDQAHLEKKAAAGASTFLFRVPYDTRWQRGLSALAREELVHFERTLRLLERRGIPFGQQRQTGYAAGLKDGIGRDMPHRLVDELLVAAIIEARSSERMALLSRELADTDAELAAFYADLVEAEERHEVLYRDIAIALMGATVVQARWQVLTAHEAAVLAGLPWEARLHSGLVAAGSTNDRTAEVDVGPGR